MSTQESAPASGIELIFLGTGTSSSLPHIECLTAPPDAKPCRTCISTLKPEGKKNIRRNTSAAIRMVGKDSRKVTIVIDVGKNFQAAALEWFPRHGLRRIDAVFITHAHADAMNGLDDLRGWTLNKSIQTHIDIYVSQATFTEVQRSFPYLVSKEFASGGGDVPQFKWHIIEDKVEFEIEGTGICVTPFSVHHGRLFSTVPPLACTPTPNATMPSTPNISGSSSPVMRQNSVDHLCKPPDKIHPYICFGFQIQDTVVYMSDVSHIPESAWSILESVKNRQSVLVLDCLRLRNHTSHMGLAESIATARRMDARRTYLTGFSHEVSHEEYVTITEVVGGAGDTDESQMSFGEREGVRLIGEGKPIWVRPAHDGLRVVVSREGTSIDETYN